MKRVLIASLLFPIAAAGASAAFCRVGAWLEWTFAGIKHGLFITEQSFWLVHFSNAGMALLSGVLYLLLLISAVPAFVMLRARHHRSVGAYTLAGLATGFVVAVLVLLVITSPWTPLLGFFLMANGVAVGLGFALAAALFWAVATWRSATRPPASSVPARLLTRRSGLAAIAALFALSLVQLFSWTKAAKGDLVPATFLYFASEEVRQYQETQWDPEPDCVGLCPELWESMTGPALQALQATYAKVGMTPRQSWTASLEPGTPLICEEYCVCEGGSNNPVWGTVILEGRYSDSNGWKVISLHLAGQWIPVAEVVLWI